MLFVVGEMHVPQNDPSVAHLKRFRVRRVGDRGLVVEHGEDALRGGKAVLQAGIQVGEAAQRIVGGAHGNEEGHELAHRRVAVDDLISAPAEDQGDDHAAQRLHDRIGAGPRAALAEMQRVDAFEDVAGAPALVVLHAVGLDLPETLEDLVEEAREVAERDLRPLRQPPHPAADVHDREHADRENHQRDQRHSPVRLDHHAGEHEDREEVAPDAGEGLDRGVAREVDVVDEAGQQLARRVAVDELQVGRDQAVEHLRLHHHAKAEAGLLHQDRLSVAGETLDDRDGEEGERQHPEQRRVALAENLVQRRLDQLGLRSGGQADDEHQQNGAADLAQMVPEIIVRESPDQRPGRGLELVLAELSRHLRLLLLRAEV